MLENVNFSKNLRFKLCLLDLHLVFGISICTLRDRGGEGAKLILNVCALHMLWLAMKNKGILLFEVSTLL